jgi:hypothetical protein
MKTRPGPRAEKLLIKDLCHGVTKPSGDEYLHCLELVAYSNRILRVNLIDYVLTHWRHNNAIVNSHPPNINGLE